MVLAERLGATLLITINRADARNAINTEVAAGIAAALDRLDGEPELRCAVLTGTGTVFCAGMDLKAFLRGEWPAVGDRGFAGITERAADKPLIAAVEGAALAGGLEVALACDLIVAAENARFGIPEAKRGLAAVAGGLLRLPSRLPFHVAMEMALTGEPIDATRAHALGLVNRIAEPGTALGEATTLAEAIARNAPLAVQASKRVIQDHATWQPRERWERMRSTTDPVLQSRDAQEGAAAFAEKREPVWLGN